MKNLLHASAAEVREQAAGQHVLVSPHHVTVAAAEPAGITAVAGYPTGRHHTLIKASEARLAIQSGADEVWVSVDATLADATPILAELVAIREACPDPARVGLILPETEPARSLAETAAAQAGFHKIVIEKGSELSSSLPVVEFPAP
ncbi:deoxyribose-phosphate aldolase [Corynebacterium rhinophilum]|uniref:deoxyribose-phosphate aldolase n=1 Tax=Corynebacterium rhinophilum TaxID=3050197 RepID=UPI00254A2EDE|nr:deoxyribose-phosphate aldolase [Corynebacterium sp. MSK090]MDK8705148.1 deoxyribose-phosphate aldolase [Corynebacterium sp. MSK090]